MDAFLAGGVRAVAEDVLLDVVVITDRRSVYWKRGAELRSQTSSGGGGGGEITNMEA